jgi:hypothetical protein
VKIGVGVEGPSDFQFWNKVLPKHYRGWRFDIRNMKNRDKLVRATPDLLEEFRGLKRRAAVIILDRDKDPCIKAVLDTFDPAMLTEATKLPPTDRYLHICVAIKKLECWYLADAQAINAVIPGAHWQARQKQPPAMANAKSRNSFDPSPKPQLATTRLISPSPSHQSLDPAAPKAIPCPSDTSGVACPASAPHDRVH